MICAHEPNLDPRIGWEARAAAARFEVTVLGFNRADGSCNQTEQRDGYHIVRQPYSEITPLYYFWRFKDTLPRWLSISALIALVPMVPLLVVAEIFGRPVRALIRKVLRPPVRGARHLVTLRLLSRMGVRLFHRGHLRVAAGRMHYIVAVLRVQFAPATAFFWHYVRDLPTKPDVVHCNDLDTLLVGILAKRKYGCRVIYDAHEFWPVADSLCRWIDTTFFAAVERLLIRKADAVVTVNPLLAEEIRRAYRLKQVFSVPNVEPWIESRPALGTAREMAALADGRVKFLFQGRFTLARGVEELIRGWVHVDAGKAALFLRGPDNMWRQQATALAAQLGVLGKSVYFLESVTEDQLVPAAAEADVGLIPYLPLALNERLSCPNKLSQYLHAGLMVVANDLPYVRSVIDEAGAGMCYDSTNLVTLADVVHQVADNPEFLRRCRQNACRFARERFNWQNYGKTFLDLYSGTQIDVWSASGLPTGTSLRDARPENAAG
jgi:glycosyltransferase involved in cell wall biosynthesis